MEKEIKHIIIENTIIDLTKKKLDQFDRAKLIKEYIEDLNISGREFARIVNINRSTIEDWLLWNKLTKSTYNRLLETGLTKTEIYNSLRTNKLLPKPSNTILIDKIRKHKTFYEEIMSEELNEQTIKLILELKNVISLLIKE